MFQGKIYKIMIGAPSDIKEEVEIAINVINHWNYLNSETHKIVCMPLHWSISSYPEVGKHPQTIINKQVVSKSDLLICVFGCRIGTPTNDYVSGSVEEIEEHLKAGKPVMIFFKQRINLENVDEEQLLKLKKYKNQLKNTALWTEFDDAEHFRTSFEEKFQLFLNDNWLIKDIDEFIYIDENEIESEIMAHYNLYELELKNKPYPKKMIELQNLKIEGEYNPGMVCRDILDIIIIHWVYPIIDKRLMIEEMIREKHQSPILKNCFDQIKADICSIAKKHYEYAVESSITNTITHIIKRYPGGFGYNYKIKEYEDMRESAKSQEPVVIYEYIENKLRLINAKLSKYKKN